jgi:GTPase Era involved in 16S rRNA processing
VTALRSADAVKALRGLATETVFTGLASAAERLRSLADQLEHGVEATYRPFRILLAGGTGVGKSTLLNALAGRPIATVGERRPTTSGFTAYLHARDDDPWLDTLPGLTRAVHQRESLEGKVLLDSPDADSVVADHRALLEHALALADMVLVVVSAEKYVSANVLRLLSTYREGREFAFVFNKMDQIADPTVVDDFRNVVETAGFSNAPVFPISARNAILRGSDTNALPDKQFDALSSFIAAGLDRARVAGIVRTNLAERAGLAGRMVRGALPPAWDRIAETWSEACAVAATTAFADMASSLRRTVLLEDELIAIIAAARGSSIAGVFGLFASITYGLRRLVPGAPARAGNALDSRLRMRMDDLMAGYCRGDEALREGFVLSAPPLGLDQTAVRRVMGAHPVQQDSTMRIAARLPALVAQELDRLSGPPGRIWSGVANLPAWGWIGYWIARTVHRILEGLAPEWEVFTGAAVVLVVAMGLQWSLVHRLLLRGARRRARTLISSVLTGLEAEVVALHAVAIGRVERRVRVDVNAVTEALEALDGLAGKGRAFANEKSVPP